MLKNESRNEYFNTVLANSGATFSLSGEMVTFDSGYAVSLDGLGVHTKLEGFSPCNLVRTVNDLIRKVDGLADPATTFVGAWVDNGNIYIDVSIIVRFDKRDEAIRKAVANNQIAIFDYKADKAIMIEEEVAEA